MTITDDDLTAIVEEICEALVEQDMTAPAPPTPVDEAALPMTAVVDINGDWVGSVSIHCQRGVAERIASLMFAVPVGDLTRADVIDALGEVANMAAGAIKGMLDGEKTLGLPLVGEGRDDDEHRNASEVLGVDYPVADGTVRLAIHQAIPVH